MASWARSGERTRALRHYHGRVELLREAVDAEPEPETRQLWEELKSA
ncbi:MAG: BTAD domain-containing putative transcriptional regulator [Gemmatimonadota bacterium]|jgi:DNA-binding SARP family transcriptional activator